MRPSEISVHVDHLLLEGLPVAADDGERVGAAVRAGLARLLAADAAPPQPPAAGPAGTGSPTVAAAGDPARIGEAIAHALHQRLQGPRAADRPAGGGNPP
jgi:hypothetical protein